MAGQAIYTNKLQAAGISEYTGNIQAKNIIGSESVQLTRGISILNAMKTIISSSSFMTDQVTVTPGVPQTSLKIFRSRTQVRVSQQRFQHQKRTPPIHSSQILSQIHRGVEPRTRTARSRLICHPRQPPHRSPTLSSDRMSWRPVLGASASLGTERSVGS